MNKERPKGPGPISLDMKLLVENLELSNLSICKQETLQTVFDTQYCNLCLTAY